MTEDEMVGWHHQLDGHAFEQALEVGDGQGSLVCCSPWGHKGSDMTEWLNWAELNNQWITEEIKDKKHLETDENENTWYKTCGTKAKAVLRGSL